jgi:hypothetical protein
MADPGATHLELRFYPYKVETQAVLVVARGLGDRSQRLRVWSGLLAVGRGDLRGLSSGECAFLLAGVLRDALSDAEGDPLAWCYDTPAAEQLGAPLGATGGTVTQLEPPLI